MHILSMQTELSDEPIEDADSARKSSRCNGVNASTACIVAVLSHFRRRNAFVSREASRFIATSDGKETIFVWQIVRLNTTLVFVAFNVIVDGRRRGYIKGKWKWVFCTMQELNFNQRNNHQVD